MGIAGVKAGQMPGTKAGAKAGDFAGQQTKVTIAKQTLSEGDNKGGTVDVGTIKAGIVTVPINGLKFNIPVVKGVKGATFPVNAKLDGNDLLSSAQDVSSPGATLTVSPNQYRQVAGKPLHTFTLAVGSPTSAKGGTIEVTPTFKGLSD